MPRRRRARAVQVRMDSTTDGCNSGRLHEQHAVIRPFQRCGLPACRNALISRIAGRATRLPFPFAAYLANLLQARIRIMHASLRNIFTATVTRIGTNWLRVSTYSYCRRKFNGDCIEASADYRRHEIQESFKPDGQSGKTASSNRSAIPTGLSRRSAGKRIARRLHAP